MDEQSKNIRSIEKSRISSCKFADRIAELVINHFRELYIPNEAANDALRSTLSQNCVSAFVLLDNGKFTVVSLGVGTKIVPEQLSEEDSLTGERVLDCHAEVLARRALIRYLYSQVRVLYRKQSSIFKDGISPLVIRDGVTFHLYCSSAPCGNACIRRWAKGCKETYASGLDDNKWPDQKHLKFTKYCDIQVSVLCKVRPISVNPCPLREDNSSCRSDYLSLSEIETEKDNNLKLFIPPGTCLLSSPLASSRASCSDKIARWCAVGAEGALFSSILSPETPIVRPTCIIIGRKFSRPHIERALCCRLASFWRDLSHPVLLCSNVKLQEGGIQADSKACFTDFALVWALELDAQKNS